jgi:hypothetical protein
MLSCWAIDQCCGQEFFICLTCCSRQVLAMCTLLSSLWDSLQLHTSSVIPLGKDLHGLSPAVLHI